MPFQDVHNEFCASCAKTYDIKTSEKGDTTGWHLLSNSKQFPFFHPLLLIPFSPSLLRNTHTHYAPSPAFPVSPASPISIPAILLENQPILLTPLPPPHFLSFLFSLHLYSLLSLISHLLPCFFF